MKKKNVGWIRAMFQQVWRNNLSIFTISQDYYELPKRTNRSTGSIYHNFKRNIYRDVQNLYHENHSRI